MKLLKTTLLLGSLFVTFSCATHTKCSKADKKDCKTKQCKLDKSKCKKGAENKSCKGGQCDLKKKKEAAKKS